MTTENIRRTKQSDTFRPAYLDERESPEEDEVGVFVSSHCLRSHFVIAGPSWREKELSQSQNSLIISMHQRTYTRTNDLKNKTDSSSVAVTCPS